MNDTVLIAIISVLGGTGLVGGIVALIKVRPEAGQILVNAAKDVVVIQQGAMTDMQRRLAEAEAARDALRQRVTELEEKVARLQQQVHGREA
jgi:hypothetical protein